MLSINDLCFLYERTKREKSDHPLFYFDNNSGGMISFKDAAKDPELKLDKKYYYSDQEIDSLLREIGYIPFIDSYEFICKCFEEYLELVNDKKLEMKVRAASGQKNYIGKVLHIFDCECHDKYDEFEEKKVIAEIRKWCGKNGIIIDLK